MPRNQAGTRTQKRGQRNIGEEESSGSHEPSDYVKLHEKGIATSTLTDGQSYEENAIEDEVDIINEIAKDKEESYASKSLAIFGNDGVVDNQETISTNNNVSELLEKDVLSESEIGVNGVDKDTMELLEKDVSESKVDVNGVGKDEKEQLSDEETELRTKTDSDGDLRESNNSMKDNRDEIDEELQKEAARKLQLEMEANLRRQEIERLAEENFSNGNKLFVYPQVVKPDQNIEVFFNRSLSILNNEPDVLIMGAFNDWRWKSFTMRLNKTQLNGDWWSCLIHIPKEAYKMDFVFFNGQSMYDNNDKRDFCLTVEGGMDVSVFDDFLLEEKRRELEKLAKEQAEKKRKEEEQRRMEEEKAACEADKALAKAEAGKRWEGLQQLMKNAASSVDNVWYLEPSEFKDGDLVKLYYNKSSGPLAETKELWVHGGHNNWEDGLTIVEELVRAKKDGDWWFASGMYKYILYGLSILLKECVEVCLSGDWGWQKDFF